MVNGLTPKDLDADNNITVTYKESKTSDRIFALQSRYLHELKIRGLQIIGCGASGHIKIEKLYWQVLS
jgi:hypothetical protein